MTKFLSDISLEQANDLQFKTTAGANAGKIEQDGNNLVLSNAVGDVLLGDGDADIYIGDGIASVDLLFEVSGSISAESGATLTLGGSGGTLNLESPNINGNFSIGATSINNKLTFTTANGYILFDHEPSGDTGEYTTEVPLLKVGRAGGEYTILSRISEYGGIQLGHDDSVWITAGDVGDIIKTNNGATSEVVILASEYGFRSYGFPNNDTAWSNRNEFIFYGGNSTAADNGLYIGDGGGTQFIDLSRNLKNIGTIGSGAITSTGSVSATEFRPTNIVTNKVVKFNGTQLDDANITDTGSLITLGSNTVVSGELEATSLDINGTADISGDLTVTNNININRGVDGSLVFQSSGASKFLVGYDSSPEGFRVYNHIANEAALFINGADSNATFAGTVTTGGDIDLPSGAALDWANGDARIVEGETNNYSLTFKTYDGSSCSAALRLDGDNTATFAGTIISPSTVYVGTSLAHYGDGDTNVAFDTNDLKLKAGGATHFHAASDQQTYLYSGNAVTLSCDASQNATFAGDVTIGSTSAGGSLILPDNGQIQFFNQNDDLEYTIRNSGGGLNTLVFEANDGTDVLKLDNTNNATFAGNIQANGTLTVGVDDTGHDVTFYGDTAGRYMYWDGSGDELYFTDNAKLRLGTGGDVKMWHNGADSYMMNLVGDLHFIQSANDKDITFQCDDGSGGYTSYLTLDGSAGYITAQKEIRLADAQPLRVGTGGDTRLMHDGNNLYLENWTGNFNIRQHADDSDIVFQCDDGSGGVETYFQLEGGSGGGDPFTVFPDNSTLSFGSGHDYRFRHNGSDSYIQNYVGNLNLYNYTDDGDILFHCDDGSGGVTPYLTLDGGLGYITVQKRMRFDDNKEVQLGASGDLSLYHVSDQSYIDNSTGNLNIRQKADDKDIIFQCDDGSGGLETYFFLDGSLSSGNPFTVFPDDSILTFGNSQDLQFKHSGGSSFIDNTAGGALIIRQFVNDQDIIFQSDDGAGSTATYFSLDGSTATHDGSATTALYTNWPDNSRISLGTGHDLQFKHTGSLSTILNQVGDLYILNTADNKDILFQCDDGSGGAETYFFLDGSASSGNPITVFPDNSFAAWGTGYDLMINHNGTVSRILNQNGNLEIKNTADDGDILFISDDGSGGTAEYFRLDGGGALTYFSKHIQLADSQNAYFGTGGDLSIYHDGSNSYISDTGTGSLIIKGSTTVAIRSASDENMIHATADGAVNLYYDNAAKLTTKSDGVDITGELQADSLDIDGVADISGTVTLGTPLATDQQKHLAWFEIAGFGTGDGTNYEISVNLDNDTAPFSHNVSTGDDGTTAITVQNIMRSGGTVMTRAGTIKRWTGWATTAGSSTANVALFKITPTRNDNSDVAPVLIDNVSYTAVGNAKMMDFDETSFTDASVAAGDIVVTGIKCEDTKTTYFGSTLEIEF